LEAAYKSAMETAEYKAVLDKAGRAPYFLTGAELDQNLKDRWVKTEKVFKDAGIIKEAATSPY
jgi:tripartite-type tricarboxylate transporter receptor subunit TctC